MSTRVLVTGAAGALGHCVAAALARDAAEVIGLHRAMPPAGLAGFSRVILGDIAGVEWQKALEGVDVVIHLAAFVHRHATASDRDLLYAVNNQATARLARACREAGVLLVFASTVSVFGRTSASPLDENSSVQPDSDYGRSKLLAEEAIRAEGARGLRYAILRFPLLYGPGGRGNMERLCAAIARGRYWPIGQPMTPKSCLHLDDAAQAIVAAWRSPTAHGGTFVVAPPRPPTLGEIHALAYSAAGRRMGPPLPRGAALAVARVIDIVLSPLRRGRTLSSAVDTLTSPSDYDGSAFTAATGFVPRVSLQDGISGTMRWVRAKP